MTTQERALNLLAGLKDLYPEAHSELTYHTDKPYEFLFAVIMSAQCTDKQVNKVTDELFKKYTTLDSIANADPAEFEQDISKIGLYRAKAKNILATAKLLLAQFDGRIPRTMDELLMLPGVARKTANVTLGQLYGINEGIAVDTHVKRLSQAFGLTTNDDPKKIEKDLMALLPREEWSDFSLRLILYGRYYWTARQKDPTGPLAHLVP